MNVIKRNGPPTPYVIKRSNNNGQCQFKQALFLLDEAKVITLIHNIIKSKFLDSVLIKKQIIILF